jgi:hypothetical protein
MGVVSVRYGGPEQGLVLLEHAVREAGLGIVGSERPSDDPTPVPTTVTVVHRVADLLLAHIRGAVAAFVRRYHRAGLDVEG